MKLSRFLEHRWPASGRAFPKVPNVGCPPIVLISSFGPKPNCSDFDLWARLEPRRSTRSACGHDPIVGPWAVQRPGTHQPKRCLNEHYTRQVSRFGMHKPVPTTLKDPKLWPPFPVETSNLFAYWWPRVPIPPPPPRFFVHQRVHFHLRKHTQLGCFASSFSLQARFEATCPRESTGCSPRRKFTGVLLPSDPEKSGHVHLSCPKDPEFTSPFRQKLARYGASKGETTSKGLL